MTSDNQKDSLDMASSQPEPFDNDSSRSIEIRPIGKDRLWSIEVNPTGSISILQFHMLAYQFGIPKSTKRIMKKRLKKKIIEILERGPRKTYDTYLT